MTKNSTIGQIGRSAFWSLINQSLGQFLTFFVFLVTARFVSKEDFGIMAMALLAIELFKQVLIESVGMTFLAKKDPTDDDYSAGFFVIFVGGSVSALLIFSFAKPFAEVFGHPNIEITLRWISLILFVTGLSKMHEVWLTKHLKFKTLAIRSITSICIGGTIGIVMAINGYGINSLIAQQIITAIISTTWLWFSCSWRPNFHFKWINIAEILNYGKFVSLNSTANFFGNQSDVALSSYYLGSAATGVYNAAKRMLTAISMIIGGGLNSVALPALASISNDEVKLQKSFLIGVGLTAILTAPMYSALAVLSSDIIYILLGPKWAEAAPILAILAVVGFSRMITQYSINILYIKQKVHWQTSLAFADAVLNIVFLVIFAKFGLTYLATAFVAKTLIFSPIITGLALNLLKIRHIEFLKMIFISISISIGIAGLVFIGRQFAHMSSILNLLVFLPVGGAIYIIIYYFIDKKSFLQVIGYLKQSINHAG
jgi:O-antigen/teichoic acid export membrane protein